MLLLGLALMASMALSASNPARAGASVLSGSLSQLESPFNCVSVAITGNLSCGTLIPSGLEGQVQVAVSPDNRNVYAVGTNALIEFSRDQATGALTEIGCVTGGTTVCSSERDTAEAKAMNDPAAIAVSPNGANVYVTAEEAGAVVTFSREQGTGLLTETGCISSKTATGCAIEGVPGLKEPGLVALSPNEKNVYVTSFGEQAIAEFERNTEEGALKPLAAPNECISSEPSSKCGTTAVGLDEVSSLAISPEGGSDIYAAATGKGGPSGGDIAEFERETSGAEEGALKQFSAPNACLTSTGVTGCESALDINGAGEIIVSPDGKNVYANSFVEGAVLEFAREPSGELKQLASPNICVSSAATTPSGCTKAQGIEGAFGVATSPDGANLYAAGIADNAIAEFSRNVSAKGALEQLASPYECITENASGCATTKAVGFKAAWLPVVSRDGTNVYLGGEHGGLVELARNVTPAVSSVNLTYGLTEGGTDVKIKGSGFSEDDKGVKVSFGTTSAVGVTVNSASSITAVSPAGAEGTVAVKVENGAGASTEVPADRFTYTDKPMVIGVSADIGSETGGTSVTISGTQFTGASTVRFGSILAASVTVNSNESITATSPPGTGTVDIVVETAGGASKTGVADRFTYIEGSPTPAKGLFLQGYCESLGYQSTVLEREGISGPGYAYENWGCASKDGSEVLIANTGPAPSMENACLYENPGTVAYGYSSEPDSAYTWGCYTVKPPEEKGGGGGGGGGESKNEGGKNTTLPPLTRIGSELVTPLSIVLPPVLAKTGNVAPVKGVVLVELPGAKKFVALSSLKQIPFGTVIEATNGTVSVTTANPDGTTQTGLFFGGQFILTQGKNGQVLAKLSGGNFSVCPTAHERAHRARVSLRAPDAQAAASGKHVVRKLWANAHGKFSTEGNYAAGAVQGTEWLTEDLCEGTLIRVTRDKVAVTNLVNHKRVEVKTGHKYLSKAP